MRLNVLSRAYWLASVFVVAVFACGTETGTELQTELPGTATTSKLLTVDQPIPNRYIVILKEQNTKSVQAMASQTMMGLSGQVEMTFSNVISGFVADMDEATAQKVAADPAVMFVEEDGVVTTVATQNNATWGLDRIDARSGRDGSYTYDFDGSGVHAYIIDTGIRQGHSEFSGRIGNGFDSIDNDTNPEDCNGHGTHVAGTVGGTVYGVAKNVTLHGVRVLNCAGSGSNAGVIAGVDWVANNAILPAVANMSLGGGASAAVDAAVRGAVSAGVTMVVAAGNSNANACGSSPAREPQAITVGSTTNADRRSGFSNFGTCLDIFAPGSSITSAWHTGNSATNTISGTSMASPHVAGVAALYLDEVPSATPAQVTNAILSNATSGAISSIGSGSPNLFLYSQLSGGAPPPPPSTCSVQEGFESTGSGFSNSNASTCSTGTYIRGAPSQMTNGGVVTQVGGAHSGSFSAYTASNTSAGSDDVDGGNCILVSPVYDVSEASTLSVSYFHGQRDTGDDANDFFRLEVSTDGGSTFTTIASRGDQATDAVWTDATFSVPANSDVVVRMQCSDGAGGGDLIECGMDDLSICAN
ncbi:MAG: S8 family serine peptidase [Myxococcota bacterium]